LNLVTLPNRPSPLSAERPPSLLGLIPFGGLYDDPGESLRDAWNKFKALPWWKKLGELFTW
jgi:hypothetical protein